MTNQQKVNSLKQELLDKIESNWHLTEIIRVLDLYTEAVIAQQSPMGIDLNAMSDEQLDHMYTYYHAILETV
jgi:hypothetical protein